MERSYFDGGLLQFIGWKLLGFFVTFFTFGICYPWAVCMIYSWETKHTVINGRRLRFTGRAIQLFGSWVKWWLLTIITFGIYGLWVPIKLKQWIVKHSEFEETFPTGACVTRAIQSPQSVVLQKNVGEENDTVFWGLFATGIALCIVGLVLTLLFTWWGYLAVVGGIIILLTAEKQ